MSSHQDFKNVRLNLSYFPAYAGQTNDFEMWEGHVPAAIFVHAPKQSTHYLIYNLMAVAIYQYTQYCIATEYNGEMVIDGQVSCFFFQCDF